MKILFDTSFFVAALLETHPMHARAFPYLEQVRDGRISGYVAAHSLAELYATLTALPTHPRISPALAYQLIERDVLPIFEIVPLSAADYLAVIAHLAQEEVRGDVTYDALILFAAMQTNVDQVITLNAKDFRRIYPAFADKITTP